MVINIKRIPEGRSALSQFVKIEGEQEAWLTCTDDLNCRAEIDRIQSQITVHLFYQGPCYWIAQSVLHGSVMRSAVISIFF